MTDKIRELAERFIPDVGHPWDEKSNTVKIRQESLETAIRKLVDEEQKWRLINEWMHDKRFGEYVLVYWSGMVPEYMHWTAVESYMRPITRGGQYLTHFMPLPPPPQNDGKGE